MKQKKRERQREREVETVLLKGEAAVTDIHQQRVESSTARGIAARRTTSPSAYGKSKRPEEETVKRIAEKRESTESKKE